MFQTKVRAAALAGGSALMLTACLFTPGKFESELQVMADGTFAYSYDGEIQMLALSKLAEMSRQAESDFEAECYDDEADLRECTEAEIAEQRAEWEAEAQQRAARQAKDAEEMKMLMGGIDPSNPEAAAELVAILERQRGWEQVVYQGDGLFDVDFRISGRLTHDFVFPTIERMPVGTAFVSVSLRDGNQVRVDATGFSAQSANPMQAMSGGMAGLMQLAAQDKAEDGNEPPKVALAEGRFTIVTDGRILANNTDEGPTQTAAGQALVWTITPRTEQAPTALIALD